MSRINRRQFIKLAGLATAASTLGACNPNEFMTLTPQLALWPNKADGDQWRVLNRITFGPRPTERHRIANVGLPAFIEEQLAPDTLPAMALKPRLILRRLETLHLDAPDLFDVDEEIVKQELQQATLLRAVYSPAQLKEVMVDFWSNHFNIDQNKSDCAWLKTIDDRDVIRPHALGNFYDLLSVSAHSPAMLFYLDNQENFAGNPNENYARELLELHTLGIDSDYTQKDIQELARCLTGWTIKEHFYRGHFTFNPDIHDDGPKQVFGFPIPAGMKQAGGERVIEMLAHHPATARFIATKLIRRFVSDDPPPQLVQRTAQTFLESQGDIKATLRAILLSPELLTQASKSKDINLKLKRPLEFVAGSLRQLNADTNAGSAVLNYLAEMGQPLFQWPTPDGYPDYAAAWHGTLLNRWRFALALVHDTLSGTTINPANLVNISGATTPAERLHQFAILLLGYPLPASVSQQLLHASYSDTTLLAALLSSPAFQWK